MVHAHSGSFLSRSINSYQSEKWISSSIQGDSDEMPQQNLKKKENKKHDRPELTIL